MGLKFKIPFMFFNLSDIFEYMDQQTFIRVAENILSHAGHHARIAYWNMLVPRRISKIFPKKRQRN